jgi:hypothetical protein
MITFYEQLNLGQSASAAEIMEVIARKRQEIEHFNSADGSVKASLLRLSEAERILLNPKLRANYDEIVIGKAFTHAPPAVAPHKFSTGHKDSGSDHCQNEPEAALNELPADDSLCNGCGATWNRISTHCLVCGADRASFHNSGSQDSPDAGTSYPSSGPAQTPSHIEAVFRFIGWSCVRGTVVSVDQPYHVAREIDLSVLASKLQSLCCWGTYSSNTL